MLNLKELRLNRRLKQSELAEILHVKQNTISNWENGKTEVNNADAIKLANFFGVSVDYLLGREETKNPPKEKQPATKNCSTLEWTEEEIALGVVPNASKSKQNLTEDEKEWLDTFHSLNRKKGIGVTRIILSLINMLVEMPNKN